MIGFRAMKKKEPKMLTVREVAEKIGAAAISVRIWASRGRFPGARKEATPFGDFWLIPETALEGSSWVSQALSPVVRKRASAKDKLDFPPVPCHLVY